MVIRMAQRPSILTGFIAVMDPLMGSEVGAFAESFPAFTTLIWFLSSVNPLMHSKVGATAEGLPTLTTFIRFLSSVDSVVLKKG